MGLTALLTLINSLTPTIGTVIMLVKNANGTTDVTMILDSAEAGFTDNLKQAQDWLSTHQKKTTP